MALATCLLPHTTIEEINRIPAEEIKKYSRQVMTEWLILRFRQFVLAHPGPYQPTYAEIAAVLNAASILSVRGLAWKPVLLYNVMRYHGWTIENTSPLPKRPK